MALDRPFVKPTWPFPTRMQTKGWAAPEASDGGGTYRIALASAPIRNELAGSCIFSLRWASALAVMVIRKIKIGYVCTTGFTAPQTVDIGVYAARDWLVSDSGGDPAPFNVAASKLDSNCWISEVAAGDGRIGGPLAVTAGVRTLDAQPMFTLVGFPTATAGVFNADWDEKAIGVTIATNSWVCRGNEGVVMNLLTDLGAAGIIRVYVGIEWDEVNADLD